MTWVVATKSTSISLLSCAVSILGCYILTCLCEQFRLCALGQHVSKVLNQSTLFFLMAVSLGVISIWGMNFLSLSALDVVIPDNDGVGAHHVLIEFEDIPQATALFISGFCAYLGLYVASHDAMFAKSKKQIIEAFIKDAKNLSFQEIKNITPWKMFYIISTKSLWYLLAGGFLTGSGAAVCASLTVWSMAIAELNVVWFIRYVAATCILGWISAILAFWILFRLLSLYPRLEILRMVSALFMAVCIITCHYTLMAGIWFRLNPTAVTDDNTPRTGRHHFTQTVGFYVVITGLLVLCFGLMVLSFVDLRSWLYESAAVVHRHEELLRRLKKLSNDNQSIISKYMQEDDHDPEEHHHGHHENTSAKNHSWLEKTVKSVSNSNVGRWTLLNTNKVSPRAHSSNNVESTREVELAA